jgi:hypothetical protein
MTKTKKRKSLIPRALPWVGNADLRSLQKEIPNSFVLDIGICLEFGICDLEFEF